MKLIFETPSKRCPGRKYNGRAVTIKEVLGRRPVKRAGGHHLQVYLVRVFDGFGEASWLALQDELFLVPA